MQVKLKVLIGSSAGKEIPVPVSRFLIGRGDDCHMRPKSDAISRNHCAILVSGDNVILRDLNSRNGTFVNDQRVQGDHELKAGDKIRIGKLEFEAVIKQGKPDEQKAAKKKEAAAEAKSDKKDRKEKKEAAAAVKKAAQLEAKKEAHAAAKEGGTEPAAKKEAPKQATPSAADSQRAKPSAAKPASDPGSMDFDISEWFQEADEVVRAQRSAEPETRQFQLDETDRIQLEQGSEATGDRDKKSGRPEKKSPGKLPERPSTMAATSRDAAADMLKKFFNNR